MSDLGEKLSAYLDGELPDAEAQRVEELLETDPAAQAEFDALMQANTAAETEFDEMLQAPAPLALARAITKMDIPAQAAPATPAQRRSGLRWGAMAASLALLVTGGFGGYAVGTRDAGEVAVAQRGWLQDIADYHRVYATQTRHLVEVSADQSDHIQTWLGTVTGARFTIPDLSAFGLTFEGGRLLVAAGKPVAQLIYTDANGAVLALCLQDTDQPDTDTRAASRVSGFDMVSWREQGAAYVVVGPAEHPDLAQIAKDAADQV